MFKKLFRKVHLWLSIPFGIVVTLICFSGAALVFENEIMRCLRHDLYYVSHVASAPLPVDELAARVAAVLPDSVKVSGVTVYADPERAYQVNLSKPRRAAMTIDQYSGEIKGRVERGAFFMAMFRLHRWLLDAPVAGGKPSVGKIIVGASTIVFVAVLLTGVVIWWPRTAKALKTGLKIVASKGWGRFWCDLHVAGGMYALLFLLAMSLTGLTWSFAWYRTGFYKVFGVETSKPDAGKKAEGGNPARTSHKEKDGVLLEKPALASCPFAVWPVVLQTLQASHPGFSQIALSDGTANVSFDQLGNQRASDRYEFDKSTGVITKTKLYADADSASKLRGWIFSVHVGSWGGMLTRILTFLSALVGASLPLTGYYLWIKRLKRKKK